MDHERNIVRLCHTENLLGHLFELHDAFSFADSAQVVPP